MDKSAEYFRRTHVFEGLRARRFESGYFVRTPRTDGDGPSGGFPVQRKQRGAHVPARGTGRGRVSPRIRSTSSGGTRSIANRIGAPGHSLLAKPGKLRPDAAGGSEFSI